MKKRIALSIVAALAGGLLAAAPASAAASADAPFAVSVPNTGTGAYTDTLAVTQTAGAGNYVAITAGADTTAEAFPSYRYVTVTGSTFSATTEGTPGLSATAQAATAWAFNGTTVQNSTIAFAPADGSIDGQQLWVATPTAGTVTVKFIERDVNNVTGIATETTLQTLTITVKAAVVPTLYKSIVDIDWLSAASAVQQVSEAILAPATVGTEGVDFILTQVDSTGTALDAAYTKAVTVTLSGVGNFQVNGGGDHVTYAALPAKSANANTFWVYADGRSGTATLTFAVDGKTVDTQTVTFYGDVATVSAVANSRFAGKKSRPARDVFKTISSGL